jgi:hypothetical protein
MNFLNRLLTFLSFVLVINCSVPTVSQTDQNQKKLSFSNRDKTSTATQLLEGNSKKHKEYAVQLLSEACAENYLQACFQLGVLYRDGEKVAPDADKSKLFFVKACREITDACDEIRMTHDRNEAHEKTQATKKSNKDQPPNIDNHEGKKENLINDEAEEEEKDIHPMILEMRTYSNSVFGESETLQMFDSSTKGTLWGNTIAMELIVIRYVANHIASTLSEIAGYPDTAKKFRGLKNLSEKNAKASLSQISLAEMHHPGCRLYVTEGLNATWKRFFNTWETWEEGWKDNLSDRKENRSWKTRKSWEKAREEHVRNFLESFVSALKFSMDQLFDLLNGESSMTPHCKSFKGFSKNEAKDRISKVKLGFSLLVSELIKEAKSNQIKP